MRTCKRFSLLYRALPYSRRVHEDKSRKRGATERHFFVAAFCSQRSCRCWASPVSRLPHLSLRISTLKAPERSVFEEHVAHWRLLYRLSSHILAGSKCAPASRDVCFELQTAFRVFFGTTHALLSSEKLTPNRMAQ